MWTIPQTRRSCNLPPNNSFSVYYSVEDLTYICRLLRNQPLRTGSGYRRVRVQLVAFSHCTSAEKVLHELRVTLRETGLKNERQECSLLSDCTSLRFWKLTVVERQDLLTELN